MSSCQNSFIGGVVRTEAVAGCRRTLLPVGEPTGEPVVLPPRSIWERLQTVPGGLPQNLAAFGGPSGSVCMPSPAALCRRNGKFSKSSAEASGRIVKGVARGAAVAA